MKIAIRIFAMTIAVTGLVSSSYAPAPAFSSQAAAVAIGPGPLSLPVPFCGPGVPGCK